MGGALGMLDVLLLLLVWVTRCTACRQRGNLVLENLLRQQLAVLTRPTRQRRRVRLCSVDTVRWVLVPHLRRDWRRHLIIVRPETVIRWRRAGWRLYRR